MYSLAQRGYTQLSQHPDTGEFMENMDVVAPAVSPLNADVLGDLKAQRRIDKIEKERERFVESMAAADFSSLLPRVGAMLNMFPDTRNSDVHLALQYWETFQPDLFHEHGILPRNLFKLERMTNLTRARAKIQNDFGLFLANEGVRQRRRANEEVMQDAVIQNAAPRPTITIFSDETGKTATWVIVASVWVLDPRAVWDLTSAITEWKRTSYWAKREIHFAKFGSRDIDPLREYLGIVAANRQFLGFKFAAVERARTQRTIEETVLRLHEFMTVEGLHHEVETNRVELPRTLDVTVDRESSLDSFALRAARDRISGQLAQRHANQAVINDIKDVPSEKSALVQLADVIGGAVNRVLNHQGEANYKDEMAQLVINTLGIQLRSEAREQFDSAAMFYV